MIYVYYTLAALGTFFVWAFIHEISHVIAYKRTVGLYGYELFLYPHIYDNHFYFARVTCCLKRRPSNAEQVIISMAPRLPDAVSAIFLLLVMLSVPRAFYVDFLIIFLLGGVVDLFVGCLGIGSRSDLRVASQSSAPNTRLLFLYAYRAIGVLAVLGGVRLCVYYLTK